MVNDIKSPFSSHDSYADFFKKASVILYFPTLDGFQLFSMQTMSLKMPPYLYDLAPVETCSLLSYIPL